MMSPRMKLDVIPSPDAPWYKDGLNFTCQQCGNCCTGGPGYVWLSDEEIRRLAEHLKLSVQETVRKYCRKVNGKISLKEIRTSSGNYDCIFLTEQKAEAGEGDRVVHPKRGCSIYPVRPLQCRTWPFWHGNLSSKAAWDRAAKGCYGINQGRKFTLEQIVELRDAKDWPEKPPTSGE
jgi:Fe-S-cluster containining protein